MNEANSEKKTFMQEQKNFFGLSHLQWKVLIALWLIFDSVVFSYYALPVPTTPYPTNIFNIVSPLSLLVGLLYFAYLLGTWNVKH